MQYGTSKQRDMARSILPSRARYAGHDAAVVRRAHRRAIRRQLQELTGEVEHDPDRWLDHLGDPTATADHAINQVRRGRRQADKLNHFERWAVATTTHLPIEDRRGHLRALLPDGLIGDHAMSHLDDLDELNPNATWRWWWRIPTHTGWRAEADRRWDRQLDLLRRALHRVLAEGHHGAFNRALRPTAPDAEQLVAPLLGHHDVDPFLGRLGPRPRHASSSPSIRVATEALDRVLPDWRTTPSTEVLDEASDRA